MPSGNMNKYNKYRGLLSREGMSSWECDKGSRHVVFSLLALWVVWYFFIEEQSRDCFFEWVRSGSRFLIHSCIFIALFLPNPIASQQYVCIECFTFVKANLRVANYHLAFSRHVGIVFELNFTNTSWYFDTAHYSAIIDVSPADFILFYPPGRSGLCYIF